MRKLVTISLTTVLFVALVFVSCAAPSPPPAPGPAPAATPAAAPIVWKAVSAYAKGSESVRGVGMFADKIKAATNGQITVNWAGGPETIPQQNQPTALRDGAVDMIISPSSYYENLIPEMSAGNLIEILVQKEARAAGIWDYYNTLHAKINAHYLGSPEFGLQYYAFSNVKVKDPKTDFKGLKFRSSQLYKPFIDKLGAVAVNVATTEVYSAMQSKLVDGGMWIMRQFDAEKAYEVVKYVINHGFYCNSLSLLLNLDKWKALSPSQQQIVAKISAEIEDELYPPLAAYEANLVNTVFPSKGMELIKFSPEDAKWYVDTANEAKWAEVKTKVSPESYAKLREMLKKK